MLLKNRMELKKYLEYLDKAVITIPDSRKKVLNPLIDYLKSKNGDPIQLNFVCTHNSRRSQLAQIWAQTAADYYKVDCTAFSSGVEVTALNYRIVNALNIYGFGIEMPSGENPVVEVNNSYRTIKCFSKLIEDQVNPKNSFAAVMTCSHADENCPLVIGMEKRIALNYDDPGKFDGTASEAAIYLERSEQIATEMFYLLGKL